MHRRALRFVRRMVLYGEKQVGSVVLQRDRNPVRPARCLRPHKAADPRGSRCQSWSASIGNDRLKRLACLLRFRKPDPDLAATAFKSKPALLCAAGCLTENAVNLVGRIEIKD